MLQGYWTIKISKKKVLFVLIFILMFSSIFLLLKPYLVKVVSDYLTINDNPVKSDIIYVMGGAPYRRVPFAVQLYKERLADKLIIAIAKKDKWAIELEKKFGVGNTEEAFIERFLTSDNIKPSDYVFLKDSLSTLDDAKKLRDYYNKEKFASAIIVTDPIHSRRSMMCINWLFKNTDVKFYSYPLTPQTFPDSFADKDDYINYLFSESGRLIYYALGLKKD